MARPAGARSTEVTNEFGADPEMRPTDSFPPVSLNPARDAKRRSATWMDAAYHSVTAMVGAGVLGLPATLSSLGWAGGIIALALSLYISWITYRHLVYMHEKPNLDSKVPGSAYTRFDRYVDLTQHVLGPRVGWWALVPFQLAVCIGICITFTVVAGEDMRAAVTEWAPAGSVPPAWAFFLMFAGLEIVLSQLPDFSSLGWVSLLGALMSACYCTIAIVLAAMHKPDASVDYTPLVGKAPYEQVFAVFNALSTIMFAYGGHNVGLEIQASLPNPPTVGRMMRGVHIAFILTGIAYFGVSITGFHALGNTVGSNILLVLNGGPRWVRTLAQLMVVVHVAAAYQVYAHPVFESKENWVSRRVGGSIAGKKVAYDGGSRTVRFVLRTLYVLACTLVACLVPFFGDLMSFFGAVAFTPTTFLLPSLLWIYWERPPVLSWCFISNAAIVAATAVIGVMGCVGSVYSIAQNARSFHLFAT